MLKLIIIKILRTYQFLSAFTIKKCRFLPTCSEYSILALEKYGLFQGLKKSVVRISKCHPWNPGGYDPV